MSDGLHIFEAIALSIETKPAKKNFNWYVNVVICGFVTEKYRQFARMQNLRRFRLFFVGYTNAYVLMILRIDNQCLET